VVLQSVNQMVLGLIIHLIYIIANSSVPEKNSTPTHTSAYKQNQKNWISSVSKSNNWHIQCIFLFSKFTFPQSRQNIIVLKLKLKLSSFGLFLECSHERLKTFFS